MGRDTNIEIFKDTENLVKKNPILKEAVAASTRMQKVPEQICKGCKRDCFEKENF